MNKLLEIDISGAPLLVRMHIVDRVGREKMHPRFIIYAEREDIYSVELFAYTRKLIL